MADYHIKRFADYKATVTISNFEAFDNTLFTCRSMMRDDKSSGQDPDFVPVEPVVFAVSNHATDVKKIYLELTDAQTGGLVSTDGWAESRWPLLDIEMTETATGLKTKTRSQKVEIMESQTYDG